MTRMRAFVFAFAVALAACADDARDPPAVTRYPVSLRSPRDVTIAHDGSILVSEMSGGRITRVDDGGGTTVFAGLTTPIGVREVSPGVLIVAEESLQSVSRLDLATGVRAPLVEGLGNVTYLTIGPDGAVYVSRFVGLDTPGRGIVYRHVLGGPVTAFATGLTVPEGLYFDGDRLVVAEWTLPSPILRFPADGGDRADAAEVATGHAHVYGVLDDGAGGVLVGDHAGRVVAHRADGTQEEILTGIGRPGALAWHPSGDLLVVEFVDFGADGSLLRVRMR